MTQKYSQMHIILYEAIMQGKGVVIVGRAGLSAITLWLNFR
jgi:hypothetical protein